MHDDKFCLLLAATKRLKSFIWFAIHKDKQKFPAFHATRNSQLAIYNASNDDKTTKVNTIDYYNFVYCDDIAC